MDQKKELEHGRDMIGQLEHIIESIQTALDYRRKVKAEGKGKDPGQLQREIVKLELDLPQYKSFLEGWKTRKLSDNIPTKTNGSPAKVFPLSFLITRLVAAGMLLVALLRLPYGYYMLLRWVVCGTGVYGTLKSVELEKQGWAWVLGIIALLFNPIIPIYLSRDIWAPIDVITALVFTVSIFALRGKISKQDKNKVSSAKKTPFGRG